MSIPTSMDEPILEGVDTEATATPRVPDWVELRIRALLTTQSFAVLCTQGSGQAYGALVAYCVDSELRRLCFATPVTTRKYRLLTECHGVAMVVDSRADHPEALMEVEALTLTGRSSLLTAGADRARWAESLQARHPHLQWFIEAPSTALFFVEVHRGFYVTRFQEVFQWIPPAPGS